MLLQAVAVDDLQGYMGYAGSKGAQNVECWAPRVEGGLQTAPRGLRGVGRLLRVVGRLLRNFGENGSEILDLGLGIWTLDK